MREEDSGLDGGPITGKACQGPLGTLVLINALSDGASTARRPEQEEERGKERLQITMNMRLSERKSPLYRSFFPPTLRLRLPPSVFEVSPPSPRLAPPTMRAHELLINPGDRKYIMVLCCALTCLFCEGPVLLPEGSAFACRSVNIILNVKIEGDSEDRLPSSHR